MDFDRLCLWCMREALENGVCSHCGMRPGWTPEPPFALPPGTVLHGRYLTGRVLGHGGFGITYLAADLAEEKVVAIKEYLPNGLCTRKAGAAPVESLGEQEDFHYGLVKFLDEARTIYQLQEIPGIITVEKLFEENGTAYYAMEFLDGQDLKHRLEKAGGRLPWQEALTLLHPVFMALEQVHRMGVTHRDISPDNIFLCRDGAVKLLDFGAARSMLQERSQSVDVILKRGYAPEEQYYSRGHQGPWTDVYALGCTVYHCITGSVPPEATERAYRDECRPAAELCPGLPDRVNQALRKAMAVQASGRFANVAAFRRALYGEETLPEPRRDPAAEDFSGPYPESAPEASPWPAAGPAPGDPVLSPGSGPASYSASAWAPPPSPAPASARPGLLARLFAWLRRLLGRPEPAAKSEKRSSGSAGAFSGGEEPGTPAPSAWGLYGEAGCYAGQWIPVQDSLVLGRNPEACQLIFPPDAPGISRVHCRVQVNRQPGQTGMYLQDLGSAWGTWLPTGQCLKNAGILLREGETFTLGEGNRFAVTVRKEEVG